MFIPSNRPTLPKANTFIVIELDPLASVAHLRNEELTEACKKLEGKKYIGYCMTRNEAIFDEDVPYHSYDIYLVQQGKTPLKRGHYLNPEWSIPILPNTTPSMYGRSIDPGIPLPRDDCYMSRSSILAVRCATKELDEMPPNVGQLTEDEAFEFDFWMSVPESRKQRPQGSVARPSDVMRAVEEKRTDKKGKKAEEVDLDAFKADPDGWLKKALADRPNENKVSIWLEYMKLRRQVGLSCGVFDVEDDDDEEEEEDEEEDEDEVDAILNRCDPSILDFPVVKVSFDLSEIEHFNDPNEFFDELEKFERLQKDHEEARLQREVEDARKVDEEYFANIPMPNRDSLLSSTTLKPSVADVVPKDPENKFDEVDLNDTRKDEAGDAKMTMLQRLKGILSKVICM
ncbi:hypothetical protein VNI00_003617 [Paramarasmius palmivorus]|uniref:Uncharacterized protein n=1 Tax=Paramarasmius palmivorus TaxID=297713 RepID=A0AAW0DSZ4_9AGAR